jgi:cell wall-associated NlpC family hydrolase
VARALSARGFATRYKLGAGGRDPMLKHPGARVAGALECDCSGFAAWCVGVDRYLPNGAVPHLPGGEWFETSALVRDARSPFGFVAEVPWTAALPGDLVVYGDSRGRQGHVGVVVESDFTGPTQVAHCSTGNARRGDAIAVTGPEVFIRGGALVARVAWVG